MYTIAVQIHGIKQLQRLEKDLVADLKRQLIAVTEVQGAAFADYSPVVWLFSFERGERDDRRAVGETILQVEQLLGNRESEMAGFTVFVDFLPGDRFEAVGQIRNQLATVFEDNVVWVGSSAATLLEQQLLLEPANGTSELMRMCGRNTQNRPIGTTVAEIALNQASVDLLVEACSATAEAVESLLVVGEDQFALRVNVEAALSELFPSDPALAWIAGETGTGDGLSSVATLFDQLNVHQTGFWLSRTEKAVWNEKLPIVDWLLAGGDRRAFPDSLTTDLALALELYFRSYARRCADATAAPVIVCHEIDAWPKQSLELLLRVFGRFAADESDHLRLLCTARNVAGAGGLLSVVRNRKRLQSHGLSRIRELAEQIAPSQRINIRRLARLSGGRSDSICHYLLDAEHWESLDDEALRDVTGYDLAWRVATSQDSDVKEVLLAASYAGRLLNRRLFQEVAGAFGIDTPRVPAIIESLTDLGLLEMGEQIVPAHPRMRQALEVALGRTARTIFDRVVESLLQLIETGSLACSEELLRLVSKYREGEAIPELYHRLLTDLMDQRRLNEAHRLLYDAVPSAGFSPNARKGMQAVLGCNRLRLALLRRNMQSAGRVKSSLERDEHDLASVRGDIALHSARLSLLNAPSKEAQSLLKHAIVEYQERGDESGLARANLDFGIVLLAQENVHGAREYFRMASMIAEESNDVFEQVRSLRYTLACEFIHGNFSRVLELSERLENTANSAGMRDPQLFAVFARARTQFELGRYESAATAFATGRSFARVYGMVGPETIMRRWLGRSLIYGDRFKRGLEALESLEMSPEGLFFSAEAWLRIGDHGQALSCLERAASETDRTHCTTESICWESGFASLENLSIGAMAGSSVLEHQVMALKGYVLAESGKLEEGIGEMYRLTREMRMSEADPFNRIYFYLYSLIIPENGEGDVEDASTVLGKAVRCIQERTSRMDQYADKTDFLKQNFWNTRLMRQAQIHNLV